MAISDLKLTRNMDFFKDREVDFSKYETSFRRWLVQEFESKRMSWQEARERFQFPHRFPPLPHNCIVWGNNFKTIAPLLHENNRIET